MTNDFYAENKFLRAQLEAAVERIEELLQKQLQCCAERYAIEPSSDGMCRKDEEIKRLRARLKAAEEQMAVYQAIINDFHAILQRFSARVEIIQAKAEVSE